MNTEYRNFAIRFNNEIGANRQTICESSLTHNLRVTTLLLSIELASLSDTYNQNKKIVLSIKTGGANWVNLTSFLIYQAKPSYTQNLLQFLSLSSEFVLAINSKIAFSVVETNSGLLGPTDTLAIWGQGQLFID
jgi:hypothetical protein